MRKLMWFTIGFTCACAIGAYLATGVWLVLLCAFCLVAAVTLFLVSGMSAKKAFCTMLGFAIGFAWLWGFDFFYLRPVRNLDGHTVVLDIEVTDYSWDTSSGIAAEGKTEIDGKSYSVQFYMHESVPLSPGDRVRGGFTLRYTAGGAETPTYHRGKGIFLLAYPKGSNTVTYAGSVPSRYFVPQFRHSILTLVEQTFPRSAAPFAKALLLGYTEDLPFETEWSLKTSGVFHVVAVSGMHVAILFALLSMICVKQRTMMALLGIPALFLFAAVAGFSPSIVRACIMQAVMILALLVDKEYDPPTALAAAVLVLLACNPLSITSVSLQLSAGCMAGMLLFTRRIHNYFMKETRLGPAKGRSMKAKLTRWFVGSVSATLGAISLTTPLSAAYFGNVNILGVLANLLILWGISFIFYGIIATCIMGALWLPLGKLVGWVVALPIHIVLWVTDMISSIPISAVYTCSIYIVAWLIFAYILLMVFLKSKKKHPVGLTVCILVGLVGALAFSWLEIRQDDYRFTAVDVGQGQCLILQNEGEYYVVDCGGDDGDAAAEKAIQLLRSQGIFRLDGLILTHYDTDHAGGADQLLSKIPADTVYLPIIEEQNDLRDLLAAKYADTICWVKEDVVLEDAEITIYPALSTDDGNECSLCILFQPADCDILITGDRAEAGELELIAHTDLPDLEILVAGHHGSRTSTSWELLNETRPEVVIISVGADNRYGHPTWDTLQRLELFGCKVYRTDLIGDIIIKG